MRNFYRTHLPLAGVFLLFDLCLIHSSRASTTPSPCDALRNYTAVIQCALENHPDIREGNVALTQSESLGEVAKQRPNPELASRVVVGESANTSILNTTLDLAHTIELGGKRDSRIEKAQAQQKQTQANVLAVKEQVYISTLVSLYRLRQIELELTALDDALETFNRIRKQYKARPKLNPEQQASLRIFQTAAADYLLRRDSLKTESDQHKRTIEYATGKYFSGSTELLPSSKENWPTLQESDLKRSPQGSRIQSAQADLSVAQADLSLAQAQSWPDLKIGPSAERQTQGPFTYYAFGANLSLPIPLFHSNQAGRAYARQGIEKSEIALSANAREVMDQKEFFFKKYESAVKALKNSMSLQEANSNHEEVEKIFNRGLLPGTLLIEVHRQVLDFTKNRNEHELSAIEALARFYALQGKLLEEKL